MADKAIRYLKLSGNKAVKDYANREASRFYQEAIQFLDAQPESEERKEKSWRYASRSSTHC